MRQMVLAGLLGLMLDASTVAAQQTKKSGAAPAQKAVPAQKADAKQPSTKQKAAPPAKKADPPAEKGTKKAAQKASVPAAKLTPAQPAGDSLLRYVPDDVFVVAAFQPSKLINAKALQDAVNAAKGEDVIQDLMAEAVKEMGLDPSKIVEAGIFIDQATMDELRAGHSKTAFRVKRQNNLKQIGLAMHNFESTYRQLPDDDGFEDSKGNLSWRVHLLPFLDQLALYQEFNLDEPWDSDHNNALIEKMPDVFKVAGVEDDGKTSIHVLTGEGTAFGGDDPPQFRDITDGLSNTILMVVAGTDKADVWTKPGGLEVDPEDPLAALGKIAETFDVGIMDGSVRQLEGSIDASTFLHLAQHQDGQVVDIPFEYSGPPTPIPGIIVRYSEPFDMGTLMPKLTGAREPKDIEIDGNAAIQLAHDASVMFPDAQTMLISSEANLKTMRATRGKPAGVKEEFAQLYPANDAVVVGKLELTDEEIEELFRGAPFAGILQSLVKATIFLDATGNNESLLHVEVTTDDEQSAQQVYGLVNGGFQVLKGQAMNAVSQEGSGIPEDVVGVLGELLDTVAIETEEATVSLDIPKVEDADKLMSGLTPAFEELFKGIRSGREQAREMSKLNAIKQMGLALHNYHDVFNGFPSWNTPRGPEENKGLSWRVHLLPYLEQAELYQEFHLDEPWDSEHNKTLIEKMPDIFKSDGVEEAGKTSFHVFLGENTPLGDEKLHGFRDIRDGSSNTLMVVQAGPDKAEIWTKPSGLEYDPEDPKKCLGEIGEQLMILLCDGSARFISSDIADVTLRRLIERSDGEVVGNY